jgi:DNA-binding MarR family transcriptional regulator
MAQDLTDRIIGRLSQLFPDLDLRDTHVTARLSRLGKHMALREEAVFERFGLNRGEVGVLSTLRMAGPPHRLSPTRLGKGLMLSSAGITSRLDRLERRGLVTRHPDPDDRRGIIVELTDHGRELVDAAIAANVASDQQLLARLSPAEAAALEDLLRTLLVALEGAEPD